MSKHPEAILRVCHPIELMLISNQIESGNTKPGHSHFAVRRWDSEFESNFGHWFSLGLGFVCHLCLVQVGALWTRYRCSNKYYELSINRLTDPENGTPWAAVFCTRHFIINRIKVLKMWKCWDMALRVWMSVNQSQTAVENRWCGRHILTRSNIFIALLFHLSSWQKIREK
jgi:hypothetical protein